MIVAVVGSRSFSDEAAVAAFVNALPGDWKIVSGGARGPDTFAVDAAIARGLAYQVFLPRYDLYPTTAALMERNRQVVDACECLVAFVDIANPKYDGKKGGTLDAVRLAMKARKPVVMVAPGDAPPTPEALQALLHRS